MILSLFIVAGGLRLDYDFDQPITYKQNGYLVIQGPSEWSTDSGAPSIPMFSKIILLPQGITVESLSVHGSKPTILAEDTRLMPSQAARIIGSKDFIPENPLLYSRDTFLPGKLAELAGVFQFRGQPVAVINFYPVQFNPARSTVEFYGHISVEIHTKASARSGLKPLRATATGAAFHQQAIAQFTLNPFGVSIAGPSVSKSLLPEKNPDPKAMTGSADYLIITSSDLAPEFSRLVMLKNLMGMRTIMTTTQWIDAHYTGVDLAEKIRKYIADAYTNWGVVWVLLGGDVAHVPTRYVDTGFTSEGESVVPADWYFACLDGNWNADGDAVFGEAAEDSVDYFPEVFVGRAYAENQEQARTFVDKFYKYQFEPGQNVRRAIFVGPQLFGDPNDGKTACEAQAKYFPSNFQLLKFYEEYNNVDLDTIMPELYRGTGIWVSISHGAYDRLYIGQGITTELVDTMSNWEHMPFATIISCLMGAFDKASLSTHMVSSPNGGWVGIKAVSRNGYVPCVDFDSVFYRVLFDHPELGAGGVDAMSRLPKASSVDYPSLYRYLYLSYTLLGDPGLFIWTDNPHQLVVAGPDTLQTGLNSFTVNVRNGSGFYIPDARVVLYKQNQIWEVRETDALGNAEFNGVNISSSGPLLLGVYKPGYKPLIDTIEVVSAGPWLSVLSATPKDADMDGYPEPGETLRLSCTFFNGGTAPVSGGVATISCSDPHITIVDSQITLPYMAPNASLRATGFTLVVSSAPDSAARPIIDFVFTDPDSIGIDTASFEVFSPVLKRWVRQLVVDSISLLVRFVPGLANKGWADADSVHMLLSSPSPGITVLDSQITVSKVEKQGYLLPWNCNQVFSLRLSDINQLEGAELRVILSSAGGKTDTLTYILHQQLSGPERVWGVPDSQSIQVMWEPPAGQASWAYLVYRADDPAGPYQLVSFDPPQMALFTDYTVQSHKLYYYKVCAVDSFFNPSPFSQDVMLATYLKREPPWPQTIPNAYISSPMLIDLDPGYPGKEIVLATLSDGNGVCKVWALHFDGTGVDGWPVSMKGEVWNEMAGGDIDGDGYPEIVVRPHGSDTVWVLRHDGSNQPGWPKAIGWTGGLRMCPALADLDHDGKLEILFSKGDKIYCFKQDGTGFNDPSGIFFQHPVGGGDFESPSVADVDQDGQLEVVCGFSKTPTSELWVFETNGNPLFGFPAYIPRFRLGPVVAVGDLIPNIQGEEMVLLGEKAQGTYRSLWCIGARGDTLWGENSDYMYADGATPALGDVDGDGVPEVLVAGGLELLVYDGDGTRLTDYETHIKNSAHTSATCADVDGDGLVEYFVGDGEGYLYGLKQGRYLEGFPMALGIYNKAVPQIGDFDNDGFGELVQLNGNGSLFAFQFYNGPAKWSNLDWKTYKHDYCRTGWIGADSVMSSKKARPASLSAQGKRISFGPTLIRNRGTVLLNLDQNCEVELLVFDAAGRLVEAPFKGQMSPGGHSISWGQDLSQGVYLLRLRVNEQTYSSKNVLLR